MRQLDLVDFKNLEKILKIKAKNKKLFLEALTHRSFLNENKDFQGQSNERLEFLGDAVIEVIVSEYLFKNFEFSEGDLTNIRALLVNREKLSEIGKKLKIENFVLLSKGEKISRGRAKDIIISNTFEAIVGVIYLENGLNKTKDFIIRHLIKPNIANILSQQLFKDPKTYFQEKAQEIYNITPSYQVIEQWGPDHDKRFRVGLYIGKDFVSDGVGPSKQKAEEEAARKGIQIKKW